MDTIREFMVSSSGLAPARRGLGLGWVISVLAGVAILLGARGTAADPPCRDSRECTWDNDCSMKNAAEPFWCCVIKRKVIDGVCTAYDDDCFCSV